MISGWNSRYREILKEFNYDKRKDIDSAVLLDSILGEKNHLEKIHDLIKNQNVFVVGAGPSLSNAIPVLKHFKKTVKIVADSAVKPLIDDGIKPNIVVTDLDGDEETKHRDFAAVRGTFEENSFVSEIEKHITSKTALGDELIGRLEKLC